MFNFLVAFGADSWKHGVYEFPRERVAVEYTEDSISERYKDLGADVIDELKSFPTLFCLEQEEAPSRVGYITSIKVKPQVVRIEFRFEPSIRPLNRGFVEKSTLLFDVGRLELHRTHWAIKDGDLGAILTKLGIESGRLSGRDPRGEALAPAAPTVTPDASKRQVFIVHGHDDVTKFEMAAELRQVGCEPVILHEQASGGLTIIEKIERYTNVGFAVVLYTPCDIGRKRAQDLALSPRARQNVVFEHGFLIGKLGRNHVMAFVKGKIETPTDISGVVYIDLDQNGLWKKELAKEMNAVGYLPDQRPAKRARRAPKAAL
ncbi:MAG: DNA-binding protein [Opitutus sp.]|nr:DNA-binding protein [Opitutus sp.]